MDTRKPCDPSSSHFHQWYVSVPTDSNNQIWSSSLFSSQLIFRHTIHHVTMLFWTFQSHIKLTQHFHFQLYCSLHAVNFSHLHPFSLFPQCYHPRMWNLFRLCGANTHSPNYIQTLLFRHKATLFKTRERPHW